MQFKGKFFAGVLEMGLLFRCSGEGPGESGDIFVSNRVV